MAKAVDPPAVYMVLDSFVVEIDGVPVSYRKGEPIHPEDRALRKWPKLFGPLVFPHPVRRAVSLAQPELRAGELRGE